MISSCCYQTIIFFSRGYLLNILLVAVATRLNCMNWRRPRTIVLQLLLRSRTLDYLISAIKFQPVHSHIFSYFFLSSSKHESKTQSLLQFGLILQWTATPLVSISFFFPSFSSLLLYQHCKHWFQILMPQGEEHQCTMIYHWIPTPRHVLRLIRSFPLLLQLGTVIRPLLVPPPFVFSSMIASWKYVNFFECYACIA